VVVSDYGVAPRPQPQVYGKDPSAYTVGGLLLTKGGVPQPQGSGGGGGGGPVTPSFAIALDNDRVWAYTDTGSIRGSVSITGAAPLDYHVEVFAQPTGDVEYYMGSSKVFIAAVEFDEAYSFAYTGTVTGTTDLSLALYTAYPVLVYSQTDAEYLQGTVQAGGAGTWGPVSVLGGDKIAKIINSGTIYAHSQTSGANDWLVISTDTGTKIAKLLNETGTVVATVRGPGP
jgi:hypothetical protein